MMPDADDIALHMPFMEDAAARASIIIEIGLGKGNGSTRAFARGLARSPAKRKMHIGVDPITAADYPEGREEPMENWFFVRGRAEEPETACMVEELIQDDTPADIIFIDTIHTYEQMDLELPNWAPLAGPQTLWIFHDTWMFGISNHMTVAILDYCALHPEWEFVDYSRESHGLGLMRWRQ